MRNAWAFAALCLAGIAALACRPGTIRAASDLRGVATPMPIADPLPIAFGDDAFIDQAWTMLRGRCVGIVANRAAMTARGDFFVDAVHRNHSICVKALFAQTGGLRGDHPGTSASYRDTKTGLPVYVLSTASPRPTAAQLAGIDVLLFDVQDIGTDAIPTLPLLGNAMHVAAALGKELWVLDRPDPLGGDEVEGPMVGPPTSPDMAAFPTPMRYGMTLGEIARMDDVLYRAGTRLQVLPVRGWKRGMFWSELSIPWTPPAHDIPTWETALDVAAAAPFAALGFDTAFGTNTPYQRIGTRGSDPGKFAKELEARRVPGVSFLPATWLPQPPIGPPDHVAAGVAVIVTNPNTFDPDRTALEFAGIARRYGILPESGKADVFDRTWGTGRLFRDAVNTAAVDDIITRWNAEIAAFRLLRAPYLLYS